MKRIIQDDGEVIQINEIPDIKQLFKTHTQNKIIFQYHETLSKQ